MNKGRFIPFLILVLMAVAAVSCQSKGGKRKAPTGNTQTSGTVVMACDATFQNLSLIHIFPRPSLPCGLC